MNKRLQVADLVSAPEKQIQSLRAKDARFDEACEDFAELSELMQRLSNATIRDTGAIDVVRESLQEVSREIRNRLQEKIP
jgi:uncharacterized protein YdcH (DUF465 family)